MSQGKVFEETYILFYVIDHEEEEFELIRIRLLCKEDRLCTKSRQHIDYHREGEEAQKVSKDGLLSSCKSKDVDLNVIETRIGNCARQGFLEGLTAVYEDRISVDETDKEQHV